MTNKREELERRRSAMVIMHSREWAGRTRQYLNDCGVVTKEWITHGLGWIQLFRRHRPGILVIDLQLAKRDGIYCLRQAKRINPDVNVIFCHSFSGFAANAVEAKALEFGANAVIQKPFKEQRFKASVQHILSDDGSHS